MKYILKVLSKKNDFYFQHYRVHKCPIGNTKKLLAHVHNLRKKHKRRSIALLKHHTWLNFTAHGYPQPQVGIFHSRSFSTFLIVYQRSPKSGDAVQEPLLLFSLWLGPREGQEKDIQRRTRRSETIDRRLRWWGPRRMRQFNWRIEQVFLQRRSCLLGSTKSRNYQEQWI